MPIFSRKRIRASLAGLFVLAGSIGGYAGYLQVFGNFHTVIDGQLYRSAQPTSAQLERYVKDHGIKTVINLRGQNAKSPWYVEEIAATQRLGVQHIDFSMSASKELTAARAEELLSIMRSAAKPILIHCQGGADRSGLASALYSRQIAGMGAEAAEGQLSFYYGHVGIPHISSAYAMDRSWERLEDLSDAKAQQAKSDGVSGTSVTD